MDRGIQDSEDDSGVFVDLHDLRVHHRRMSCIMYCNRLCCLAVLKGGGGKVREEQPPPPPPTPAMSANSLPS